MEKQLRIFVASVLCSMLFLISFGVKSVSAYSFSSYVEIVVELGKPVIKVAGLPTIIAQQAYCHYITRPMAVAYGNGTFVLVTRNNKIYISNDATAWEEVSHDGWGWDPNFHGITFAQERGIFVAVGDSNTIAISKDGRFWEKVSCAGWGWDWHLVDVAYGNGRFVAVGETSQILTSADGINWEQVPIASSFGMNNNLYGVTYGQYKDGQGQFVAVGQYNRIITSIDGLAWEFVSSDSWGKDYNLYAVTYGVDSNGAGVFVAVGESNTIKTSPDGKNWEIVSKDGWGWDNHLHAVTYANGVFVAVGDNNTVLYSSDGKVWKGMFPKWPSLRKPDLYAVTYGPTAKGSGFVFFGGSTTFSDPVQPQQ